MSFKPHSVDGGRVPGWEYHPCSSAVTPKIGLAMVQNGGVLTVATGSAVPSYICMCEKEEACKEGDIIPCIRVHHDIIFETTITAAPVCPVGSKVTLSDDGLEVTAEQDGGVAELVYIDGAEEGCTVRVRF